MSFWTLAQISLWTFAKIALTIKHLPVMASVSLPSQAAWWLEDPRRIDPTY
jgi:hypothetical protein